ncbi:MAG: bifunctional [glutamine synthetase] adenylyltransferase/[glutamine synthetase]-adenylyl-L-tyrosine phosphorylase, partial [Acidimicrobiales bacterium]
MIGPHLQAAIGRSADPGAVAVAVQRLIERDPLVGTRLEDQPHLREALVAVLGASRSLAELCLAEPAAVEVLADLDVRLPPPVGATTHDLRGWKRLELLRLAARDLVGIDDLPTVGRGLARMADEVLEQACGLVGTSGLAVVGMGKLGGAELNYSSDIDVMFVADSPAAGERDAREVLEVARTCFRVDVDLRPEGRDGPLVRSLASYEAYWGRWAHTWEFQALLKARPVAGDPGLGAAFSARAAEHLWNRPFTSDDLRAVRTMKARAEGELARKRLADREVKRGRGGIRDIEFAVQLLQLVHGGQDPALRSPTTLDALAELGHGGYVEVGAARALDHAYRLLRTVEHRLQLLHEQQVHVLPNDTAALDRLARVMGYRDNVDGTAGELLVHYLHRQQAAVRSIHEHLFFRPLLDALLAGLRSPNAEGFRGAVGGKSPPTAPTPPDTTVEERLAAFGLPDAYQHPQ